MTLPLYRFPNKHGHLSAGDGGVLGDVNPTGNINMVASKTVDGVDVSRLAFYKQYEVGDGAVVSHDAVVTADWNEPNPVKKKDLRLDTLYPTPTTLRIKFDLKIDSAVHTVYGRIYRNGTAVGTTRSTNSTNYITYSEDLNNWSEGDNLQLYMWTTTINPYYGRARNFQIHGLFDELTFQEALTDQNIGKATPIQTTVIL